MREIFDEIDADKNGTLDRSELSELFARSHGSITSGTARKQWLDAVMAELGDLPDGTTPGEIDFDHFLAWYTKHLDGGHGFMKLIEKKVEFSPIRTLWGPFMAVAVEYTGLSMLMPM